MQQEQRHSVDVWRFGDVWIERYRHAPGPTAPVATHAHAEYQFGLSLDAAGEYHYRGSRHPIAPGDLRLIQPGEMHASRDFGVDRVLTTHLLYVPQRVMHDLTTQIAGVHISAPVFATPVVNDANLAATLRPLFLAAESSSITGPDPLAWESHFLETLATLVGRHAENRVVAASPGSEPGAVATVRAFLHDHLADNVSLTSLAELVGLTPAYLDRAFARAVGVPPHRYQVQLRVIRAKGLLETGMPIDAVARLTGFADQSHLGRHFKRLVGVSPGRYGSRLALVRQEKAE